MEAIKTRTGFWPSLVGTIALASPFALGISSPGYGQSVSLSVVNNSICYFSDTNNDQSSPTPYDPGHVNCNETLVSDLNVFGVSSAVSGSGTSAVLFEVDAAVVVDANPGSWEYQAGKAAYALTLSVTGTGGAAWDLTVDKHMQGLVVTVDDGAGFADSSISGVTAALNLGPSLSFGTMVSRSSASTGSLPFSESRNGDVIQGVGDTVLTGNLEITLDAYSECGGLFCLGWADEGAVLFGIDNVSQSSFVTADEYSTWGRAVAPDGYQANFTLALTGGICGDGTTDTGEECDDGGTSDNDGCSSTCVIEFCGDGTRQSGIGEECDDGNVVDGDGCSATCTVEGIPVPALSERGLQGLILVLGGSAALIAAFSRRRVPSKSPARIPRSRR